MATTRLLISALVLTLAVAITAAVFAIWPVVADAPWLDYNDDAPTSPTTVGLTATEAEIYTRRHVRDLFLERSDVLVVTTCHAEERISAGWLVRCDLTNFETGRTLSQFLNYVVDDDGKVSDFP